MLESFIRSINHDRIEYYEGRLDRLKEIIEFNTDIPVITVTGTNGKGSTVTALKKIYQEAGFRVGVFSSPHLLRVNERIQINDAMISDEALKYLLAYFKQQADDVGFDVSFFELLCLVALSYFTQARLDLIVLEVGMGGRLDASNLVDADLVIVTNVDLDHQDFLGDSIEKIALEKAGLFREQQLVIYADTACPLAIQQQAELLNVDLRLLGRDYQYVDDGNTWSFDDHKNLVKPNIHLSAMAAACYASQVFKKLSINMTEALAAIPKVFIPGRFQHIDSDIPIIIDVAHNPHAVRLLRQRLESFSTRIHAVFSVLKDKNGDEIVAEFNKLDVLWYTCIPNTNRSHSKDSLAAIFTQLGIAHQFEESPVLALEAARAAAKPNEIIVVFGSFTVIEPIMLRLIEEGIDVFSPN